jgi:hypothetical protein
VEETPRPVGDPGQTSQIDQLCITQECRNGMMALEKTLKAVRRSQRAVARDSFTGNSDAHQAAAQRDEPDPVAAIHEVDRR